jgi:hypothetical protein
MTAHSHRKWLRLTLRIEHGPFGPIGERPHEALVDAGQPGWS